MAATRMETGALEIWRTPQSPFPIQYSRRALEEIRLAVVEAFFSLPRGGVEIGGVLLGKFRQQRMEIADYAPLECEHAFGPSFRLSPRDQQRLEEVLAAIPTRADGYGAVGWYHSHNRSEIFLSEADLEIHRRYFPKPWQVALVVRPSLSQPMRAGFFLREGDGSIRATASYQEFVVEPFARRAPTDGVSGAPAMSREPKEAIEVPLPLPAGTAEAQRPREPAPTLLPAFLQVEPPRSRAKLWIGAALAAGAALGVLVFQTRGAWWPPLRDIMPLFNAGGLPSPASTNWMSATDNEGQLQIRWDTASRAVAEAPGAVLSLSDGGQEQQISLDAPHLRAGSFTYTRHSERVDARLTIQTPRGPLETATTFLGTSPAILEAEAAAANAEAAALARQNDELRQQAAALKSQLDAQTARARLLELRLNELRKPPERKRATGANGVLEPIQ